LEAVEGPEEFAASSRVFLHQFGWFEAGVGDITAPASRDADLGEEVRGGFEEGDDAFLAHLFGAGDRREEAGGSSAEDGDVARVGH